MVQQIFSKNILFSIFVTASYAHAMCGAASSSSSLSPYAPTPSSANNGQAQWEQDLRLLGPELVKNAELQEEAKRTAAGEPFSVRVGKSLAGAAQPIFEPSFNAFSAKLDAGTERAEKVVAALMTKVEESVSGVSNTVATTLLPAAGDTAVNVVNGVGVNAIGIVRQTGTALVDLGNTFGTTVIPGIGHAASGAIQEIGATAERTTDALGRVVELVGAQVNMLPVVAGQSTKMAAAALKEAIAEGVCEGGQELRRDARFFVKILWQHLGLGAAAVGGGLLAYKKLATCYAQELLDKKAAALGVLGVGIAGLSVGIATWLLKQDQVSDNEDAAAARRRSQEASARIEEQVRLSQQQAALRSDQENIMPSLEIPIDLQLACEDAKRAINDMDKLAITLAVATDRNIATATLRQVEANLFRVRARVVGAFNDVSASLVFEQEQKVVAGQNLIGLLAADALDRDVRIEDIQNFIATEDTKRVRAERKNWFVADQTVRNIDEAWRRIQQRMPARMTACGEIAL